jgi:hypothetical protein
LALRNNTIKNILPKKIRRINQRIFLLFFKSEFEINKQQTQYTNDAVANNYRPKHGLVKYAISKPYKSASGNNKHHGHT